MSHKTIQRHILEMLPISIQLKVLKHYDREWIELLDGLSFIPELPRLLSLRHNTPTYNIETDADIIMYHLDKWVAMQRPSNYVPVEFYPDCNVYHGIQQNRDEIHELINVILQHNYHDGILEIGLGYNGGTHIIWRQLFNQVYTIEMNRPLIYRFRLKEKLDKRSHLIAGLSNSVTTYTKLIEQNHPYNNHLVEVLFIDGSHKYEDILADWTRYHHFVMRGGLIVFHDSISPMQNYGVARFVDDLASGKIDKQWDYNMHLIKQSKYVGISYYFNEGDFHVKETLEQMPRINR